MLDEFTFIENIGEWDFTVPVDSQKTRSKIIFEYLKTWAKHSNDWVGVNSYDGIFLTYKKKNEKKIKNIENEGYTLEYKSRMHIKPIDVFYLFEKEFKKYGRKHEENTDHFPSFYRLEIGCSVNVNYIDKGVKKLEFIGYSNPPDFKFWKEDISAYLYIDFIDDFEDTDYFKLYITTDFTGWIPSWFTDPIKKECAIENNEKLSNLLKALHNINPDVKMRWGTSGSKPNIRINQYGFQNE